MPRKEKPPKEKKVKPPKEKKAKPPKEKKPKPPKKQKAPKPPKVKKPRRKGKGADEVETTELDAYGQVGKKSKKEKGPPGKVQLMLTMALPMLIMAGLSGAFTMRSIAIAHPPEFRVEELEELLDGETEEGSAEEAEGSSGQEGEVGEPSGPPAAARSQSQFTITSTMTTPQTVEYIESMTPAALGLPGESMDEYEVIASEFVVYVDGSNCTQVTVYKKTDGGGNAFAGRYLITRGGAMHLYRKTADDVEELPLTAESFAAPKPEESPAAETQAAETSPGTGPAPGGEAPQEPSAQPAEDERTGQADQTEETEETETAPEPTPAPLGYQPVDTAGSAFPASNRMGENDEGFMEP